MSNSNLPNVQMGLIGLGVMGRNLALNIANHEFQIAVWNRTVEKARQFVEQHPHPNIRVTETLRDFVQSLARPRRVLLMIDAGRAVDETLRNLIPLLEAGDTVIDGGNSWFEDTERRAGECARRGLRYLGMGISGGEQGARFGPSLMPGGDPEAYTLLRDVLEKIAARSSSGPCVTFVGPGGAGHFVKMVHNGIEYADMQIIAEAYDFLRKVLRMNAAQISEVFAQWNRGRLESFLMDLTVDVLRKKDERTGNPLVDMVLDKAGQKGTGAWTLRAALDLNIPVPSIAAAVDARFVSRMKTERLRAAEVLEGVAAAEGNDFSGGDTQHQIVQQVEAAVLASKICAYAQGLSLIRGASTQYDWNIDLSLVVMIWKAGCIIRAGILDAIMRVFQKDKDLSNVLVSSQFAGLLHSSQPAWRSFVMKAALIGVPHPCIGASLSYFDSYRSAFLPHNLTQAQRDAFGAHTYQRADDPNGPFRHSVWLAQEAHPLTAAAGGAAGSLMKKE